MEQQDSHCEELAEKKPPQRPTAAWLSPTGMKGLFNTASFSSVDKIAVARDLAAVTESQVAEVIRSHRAEKKRMPESMGMRCSTAPPHHLAPLEPGPDT